MPYIHTYARTHANWPTHYDHTHEANDVEKWAGLKTWVTLTRAKSLWTDDWVRTSPKWKACGVRPVSSGEYLLTVVRGGTNHEPATGCWVSKAHRCARATKAILSDPNRQKGYCGKSQKGGKEEWVRTQCIAPYSVWGCVAADWSESTC